MYMFSQTKQDTKVVINKEVVIKTNNLFWCCLQRQHKKDVAHRYVIANHVPDND